ncbi:MAG TPA: IclR family transcriptional regulator C-terminal domain-containing protein, partial [Anaerolineae bacterium]|nr:IclR family transcriptional regulator C-terminal domain-containing protein [Anaerolineae bacterium]
ERTENRRYALGTAFITLTQSVRINVELRDRGAPLLRNLADAVHESVYLAALEGDCAVYVYAIESPSRLLARTAVGNRAHLHATALGKAMLAHLPEDELEAIVASTGLPAYTEATITDMDALMADREQTDQFTPCGNWFFRHPRIWSHLQSVPNVVY